MRIYFYIGPNKDLKKWLQYQVLEDRSQGSQSNREMRSSDG